MARKKRASKRKASRAKGSRGKTKAYAPKSRRVARAARKKGRGPAAGRPGGPGRRP